MQGGSRSIGVTGNIEPGIWFPTLEKCALAGLLAKAASPLPNWMPFLTPTADSDGQDRATLASHSLFFFS